MTDRYVELRDRLPPCYVEFIESHGGWEGGLGDEFGWVVVWDRETIQERWDAYEMALSLSDHWFPFGSDGGGEMLCFDLTTESDTVFWMPYIGMSDEDGMEQPYKFADIAAAIRTMSTSDPG